MIGQTNKSCILLFVKSPVKGRVKARLGTEIGAGHAAELYRLFVLDLLSLLTRSEKTFRVCFYPPEDTRQISQWFGRTYEYIAQQGQNLGQRMKNALKHTFADNFSKAVLIGSDIPDIPNNYLKQAVSVLDTNDAVIGPAQDGGYYLIGFTKSGFCPEVFDGINWGGNNVFEQTLELLKRHKRAVCLLPQWYDIDTIYDLKLLLLRNKNTAFTKSKTYCYLRNKKLWSDAYV